MDNCIDLTMDDDDVPAVKQDLLPPVKQGVPEVIDLISDDEDEEPAPKKVKRTPFENRTNHGPFVTTEDVEVVAKKAVVTALPTNDDDDDFQMVGRTGTNALEDFPHLREHCVVAKWAVDPKKFCANCYCAVCDVPVSKCVDWKNHCRCKYGTPELALAKAALKEGRPAPQMTTTTALTGLGKKGWKPRELLTAITKVLPEAAQPGAIVSNLRHYQLQQLHFMLQVERGPAMVIGSCLGGDLRSGMLCSEVGMGKTAAVLALVAANPLRTNSVTSAMVTNHYRDAAAAEAKYTLEMEQFKAASDSYLSSLSAGVPPPKQPVKKTIDRLKLKGTVVFTSVSLLGQWEDECQKHAPSFRVFRYHPGKTAVATMAKMNHAGLLAELEKADIIITSSTFHWIAPACNWFSFHRVVHDESHLLKGSASCRLECANKVHSGNRWAVTATPMEQSSYELKTQIHFLGLDSTRMAQFYKFSKPHLHMTLDTAADILSKYMVRHVKAQRIGGDIALALPDSTTTTTFLDMSSDERQLYQYAYQQLHRTNMNILGSYLRNGGRVGVLQNTLARVLGACGNSYDYQTFQQCPSYRNLMVSTGNPKNDYLNFRTATKLSALHQSLTSLRQQDPNIHAVVFTAHRTSHAAIVRMLKGDSFVICEFGGSTPANQRDKAIRSFQTERRAAVFVITIRAGSVGMTLTAANHVFLMEPMIDPALEVQAAGRIHRLGQTKAVTVTRFAFRNSIEDNIIKVHKDVADGKINVVDGELSAKGIKVLLRGLVNT